MHIPREIAREIRKQGNDKISEGKFKMGHVLGTIVSSTDVKLDDFKHNVSYTTLVGVNPMPGDRVLVAIVKGGKGFVVEGVLR